jgi:hypothetical protein
MKFTAATVVSHTGSYRSDLDLWVEVDGHKPFLISQSDDAHMPCTVIVLPDTNDTLVRLITRFLSEQGGGPNTIGEFGRTLKGFIHDNLQPALK